ncbi:5-oxoprolinase subunit PxpB [Neptunicella marina]|uniref:5-oxoprolinase subunit PxpB n=1 Tax=Neptunicella marina TaxID=2125989 RepID=A0A8J6LWV0_9ALTE|nr:5-oxoprolinase subunit PxpB [Neptunicella marina]MBC3764390.1 5-oxoprolinase subunit PxpB [Neptunicella marina]
MRIQVAAENALIIYFAEQVSEKTLAQVQAYTSLLADKNQHNYVIDLVPSYTSLMVVYDVTKINHSQLVQQLETLAVQSVSNGEAGSKDVVIPVYYSLDTGPDLERIATHHQIDVEKVIELHQSQSYLVYAIGFAPGFAYLGSVPPQIAMPRLSTPRKRVPKGAVAIADRQTAVYPAASPGGWNIIGNSPMTLFDPSANPVMPFNVGDRVRFESVNLSQFKQLGGQPDEF